MASTEVLMSRRNTRAFIKAKPITLVLYRPVTEITEAGGTRDLTPQTLQPQVFRMVPLEGYVWDRQKNNSDVGRIEDVQMNLIGYYNADIKTFDYFSLDNQEWQVIHVQSQPESLRERTLATVRLQDNDRT